MNEKTMLSVVMTVVAAVALAAVKAPEYRAVETEDAAEVMVFGTDGRAETGRFKVGDVMDKKVFGKMNRAPKKFLDTAATASLAFEGDTLNITVDCPLPSGMKFEDSHDPWNGDRVIVNIRPRLDDTRCSCFCINATGKYAAHGFKGPGARDMGWSSRAVLRRELSETGMCVRISVPVADAFGGRRPEPGEAFGINISRRGPSVGSYSAWAMNGGQFNLQGKIYGTAICGGARPYFERRLEACRREATSLTKSPGAAAEIDRVTAPVGAAIAAHADEPGGFAALERMFGDLAKAYLAISHGGEPLFVFSDDSAWTDVPEPVLASKPFESCEIRIGRNARFVRTFAIANLGSSDFTGEVKFFDLCGRYFYASRGAKGFPEKTIAERFSLLRGLPVSRKDGKPDYDVLVPLPFGSIVQIAPGTTAPLYAELDTAGVEPGEYSVTMVVKGDTKGYGAHQTKIRVVVTDDDLSTAEYPHAPSTHAYQSFIGRKPHPAKNYIRYLVSRGYNYVRFWEHNVYPALGADGVWRIDDFSPIDRYLDAWIEAGIDRERLMVEVFVGAERFGGHSGRYRGFLGRDGQLLRFASPEYDAAFRAMITQYAEHLKAKYGVYGSRLRWLTVDEPGGDPDAADYSSSMSKALYLNRLVKQIDPALGVASDPLGREYSTPGYEKTLRRLAENCDIVKPYRPNLTAKSLAMFKSMGFKEIWTYHISGRSVSAAKYRAPIWQALADGLSPCVTFWHSDESAAVDCSRAHPYGTNVVDWDYDRVLPTRRQIAADIAREDAKLIGYLRRRFAGDAARLEELEKIVKTAADDGTMAALDEARVKLGDLLVAETTNEDE